jgi:hypothetical protein
VASAATKKPIDPLSRRRVSSLFPCSIAGFLIAALFARSAIGQELPSCKSPEVESAFIQAINNSPAGLTRGLRALGLDQGFEVYTSKDGTVRLCTGWAHLNTGNEEYHLLLGVEDNGKWSLQTMSDAALIHKGMHPNKVSDKMIKDCLKEKTDEKNHALYCMDGLGMELP